ncbi:MAG: hybrid sensor histidine kinase/response regulator [Hyphomicrobiales bacterium]|nr:hybrid sensor histidine kinase/response regulator [Hyphomicrobiales bacterium]
MALEADQLHSILKTTASAGTWHWDVKSDVLKGDNRLADIFSTRRRSVNAGVPVDVMLNIIHPHDRRSVFEAIELSVAKKSLFSATYRVMTEDEPRFVKAFGRCFSGPTGLVHVGVVFDLTEFSDDVECQAGRLASFERLDRIAYHLAIHKLATAGGLDSIAEWVQPLIQDVGYRFGENG